MQEKQPLRLFNYQLFFQTLGMSTTFFSFLFLFFKLEFLSPCGKKKKTWGGRYNTNNEEANGTKIKSLDLEPGSAVSFPRAKVYVLCFVLFCFV